MTYNQYIEGYSNDVFVRHYIEGYKTLNGLKRAVNRFLNESKTVQLGYVLFTFNGLNKYRQDGYKIFDKFNTKAYFEFWN